MSYAEIKHALNSTLGTNEFKPLNELIPEAIRDNEMFLGVPMNFNTGMHIQALETMKKEVTVTQARLDNNKEIVFFELNKKCKIIGDLNFIINSLHASSSEMRNIEGYIKADFGNFTMIGKFLKNRTEYGNNLLGSVRININTNAINYMSINFEAEPEPTYGYGSCHITVPFAVGVDKIKISYKVNYTSQNYSAVNEKLLEIKLMQSCRLIEGIE